MYIITVVCGSLLLTTITFASYIILTPYYLMPGENITIQGNDLPSNEFVIVSVGNQKLPPLRTDTGGTFSLPLQVPNTGGKSLPITVYDPSGTKSTSSVVVGTYYPFVTPTTYYVLPGGTVRFNGIRFAPNESVQITGNNIITNIQADTGGTFETGAFPVGYTAGEQTYRFTGINSNTFANVTIYIGKLNPWLTLDTYYAPPGSSLTISGHFFGLNESVSVFFEGSPVGTVTTDNRGEFSVQTFVPALIEGFKLISAQGLTTGAEATSTFSEAAAN